MSLSIAKRCIGITGALAATMMVSAVPILAAAPAHAEPYGWHGNYHRPPPPRYGWHGGYHPNTGAVVGGALIGLGVGAAIGALAAPPVVYAPPPAYYPPAPPPVYYGY